MLDVGLTGVLPQVRGTALTEVEACKHSNNETPGGGAGLRYVTLCGTQSVNSCWVSSQGSYLPSLSENQTISSAPPEIFYPPPHPTPTTKDMGVGITVTCFLLEFPSGWEGKAQTASRGLVDKLIRWVHAHGWDIRKGIWSGTERDADYSFLILIF